MTHSSPRILALAVLVLAAAVAPAQQGKPVSNRAGTNPPAAQPGTQRPLSGTSQPAPPPPANTGSVAQAAPKPKPSMPAPAPTRVVYVKAADAPIRSATGSQVIATAQQGAALSVIADDKLQYKVRLKDGREGVVAKRLVQDQPPSRGGLGIVVADDRRGSEMRTATSARGLNEQAKASARAEGVEESAIAAVETMEKYYASIPDATVVEFAKQGGVQK